MKWIAAGLTAIFLSVELLRYLTYLQKNNYLPVFTKKVVIFYAISRAMFLPTIIVELCFAETDLTMTIKSVLLCCMVVGEYLYVISCKTGPKFTKRAKVNYWGSLIVLMTIILLCTCFIKGKIAVFTAYAIAAFAPIFMIVFVRISNVYFEKKNKLFAENEIKKIADSNIIKIGITGSFGKTSCKNILNAMLSKKFKTIMTESNFNTPMGLALTAKKVTDEEVFIAEMGARKKGDIKYLCDILKPDIGIITGVCEQHLKTFGSLHEIFLEKKELSNATPICVFNGNDKYALKMYKERKAQKIKICVDKIGDIYADEISVNESGSGFSLHIDNKVCYVKTKLLGKHNIQNILLCVAIATYLGVKIEDIIDSIEHIEPIEHRLEYSYANGIHIIDDGYNSNEVGIRFALEVLDGFRGRKVVVGQGIVECGKKTRDKNVSVGKIISQHADVIIACGSNRKYIEKGAKDSGFLGEIYSYRTLNAASKHFKTVLKNDDVLLLQNDIPDIM